MASSSLRPRISDKDSLDRDFRELMGIDENKPFECVGTRREVQTCMKHFRKQGGKSLLTDRYARVIDSTGENLSDLLDEWNDENHVPDAFAKVVSSSIKEL